MTYPLSMFISRCQSLVNMRAEILYADPLGKARFIHYLFRLFIYVREDDTNASLFTFFQKFRQGVHGGRVDGVHAAHAQDQTGGVLP